MKGKQQKTIVLFISLLAIFALTSANLLEEKTSLSMRYLPSFPWVDCALVFRHSPVKGQLLGDKMQLLNNISSLFNLRETQKMCSGLRFGRGGILYERWTS